MTSFPVQRCLNEAFDALLLPSVIVKMIKGYSVKEGEDFHSWYDVRHRTGKESLIYNGINNRVAALTLHYNIEKTGRIMRMSIMSAKYDLHNGTISFLERENVFICESGMLIVKGRISFNIRKVLENLDIYNNSNFKRIIIGNNCIKG